MSRPLTEKDLNKSVDMLLDKNRNERNQESRYKNTVNNIEEVLGEICKEEDERKHDFLYNRGLRIGLNPNHPFMKQLEFEIEHRTVNPVSRYSDDDYHYDKMTLAKVFSEKEAKKHMDILERYPGLQKLNVATFDPRIVEDVGWLSKEVFAVKTLSAKDIYERVFRESNTKFLAVLRKNMHFGMSIIPMLKVIFPENPLKALDLLLENNVMDEFDKPLEYLSSMQIMKYTRPSFTTETMMSFTPNCSEIQFLDECGFTEGVRFTVFKRVITHSPETDKTYAIRRIKSLLNAVSGYLNACNAFNVTPPKLNVGDLTAPDADYYVREQEQRVPQFADEQMAESYKSSSVYELEDTIGDYEFRVATTQAEVVDIGQNLMNCLRNNYQRSNTEIIMQMRNTKTGKTLAAFSLTDKEQKHNDLFEFTGLRSLIEEKERSDKEMQRFMLRNALAYDNDSVVERLNYHALQAFASYCIKNQNLIHTSRYSETITDKIPSMLNDWGEDKELTYYDSKPVERKERTWEEMVDGERAFGWDVTPQMVNDLLEQRRENEVVFVNQQNREGWTTVDLETNHHGIMMESEMGYRMASTGQGRMGRATFNYLNTLQENARRNRAINSQILKDDKMSSLDWLKRDPLEHPENPLERQKTWAKESWEKQMNDYSTWHDRGLQHMKANLKKEPNRISKEVAN